MKKGTSLERARLEGFLEGEHKMLARLKRHVEFLEADLREVERLSTTEITKGDLI